MKGKFDELDESEWTHQSPTNQYLLLSALQSIYKRYVKQFIKFDFIRITVR